MSRFLRVNLHKLKLYSLRLQFRTYQQSVRHFQVMFRIDVIQGSIALAYLYPTSLHLATFETASSRIRQHPSVPASTATHMLLLLNELSWLVVCTQLIDLVSSFSLDLNSGLQKASALSNLLSSSPMTSRSKSSPQVHQIKAIFEGYRNALSRPSDQNRRGNSYRSKSSTDISDQSNEQPDPGLFAREPTNDLSNTIESIIDTQIPISSTIRPALSQKPSWVGPPQVNRLLYDPRMTRKMSIEYSAVNLQPPVFVTTSLSSPPWEIIEMEAINHPEGQYLFKAEFDAMEGEYQYKFRLGPGDWWVCDESKPMIDDGIGNRNNILYVQGAQPVAESQVTSRVQSSVPRENSDRQSEQSLLSDPVNNSTSLIDLDTIDRNAAQTISHTKPDMFTHNSSRSMDVDIAQDEDDRYHDDQIQDQIAEDAAPLMRHETISPTPADSPMALTSPRSSASERSSSGDPVSPEGDPNDPSLHHFPTHHAGIMRRAQSYSEKSTRRSN
ncbi:hypothetical protein MRB53_042185 [Persea americana]|nr:hypothetical protein MRB53_042185 [Persea americana]